MALVTQIVKSPTKGLINYYLIRCFCTKLKSVIISDSCVQRLKKLQENEDCEKYLRITVDGGGCSGFQYKFDLDSNINKDDKIFSKDGVSVVVDEVSLDLIDGSTLEYHEELIKSSFRIANNPQAQEGCSCGASFSIKIN